MKEEVGRYLEKADHALVVAQGLMEQGHMPDAASKVYYAMFYATKALLAAEGIEVSNIQLLNLPSATISPNQAA